MSPRHFYNYSRNDPKGYKAFSDNLHNSFVSFTHAIGLKKFFSLTLPFLSEARSAERCDLVSIKSGPIDVWNNDNSSNKESLFIAVPPTGGGTENSGGTKKDTKPLHRDLYK